MPKKPKATENTAKDVEQPEPRGKESIDKETQLWAQYGQLQAERERLGAQIQQIIARMQQIYGQILKLQEKANAT